MHYKKFYITTPIYYVTAKPHLGSLYSTVLADFFARWYRLRGFTTRMVTGTDEHGQKVAQAAASAHKDPQTFVDECVPFFTQAWNKYGIHYDRFIRTTDSDHKHMVHNLVASLQKAGALYENEYTGWYCTPCETFVNEDAATIPSCTSCGRETKRISERAYFFALSSYQQKLLDLYATHPDFIVPKERAQEVYSFVASGLKDLCISRSSVTWGIPFEQDPALTIYVWVEALCNYITAAQDAAHPHQLPWWPADMHVLGKDIIKFHAVYWPAMLMAANLPLPRQLLVHGWLTVDGQKMSKSLGNVVDPMTLVDTYGADPVRYYLLKSLAVNQDADFSHDGLAKQITSDLSNDLGNLLQRSVVLAQKYQITTIVPPAVWSSDVLELRDSAYSMVEDVVRLVNERMVHLAIARISAYVHKLNSYFHEQQPWKKAPHDMAAFTEIISATMHGLHTVALLLYPVMPQKMHALLSSIGKLFVLKDDYDYVEHCADAPWHETFVLKSGEILFPKLQEPIANTAPKTDPSADTQPPHNTAQEQGTSTHTSAPEIPTIDITTFGQVHMVIGTILEAHKAPKSDKLLVLTVDCGSYGIRQILSGVAQWYTPEALTGTQALFVCNLAPRQMMGMVSEGMMICAKDTQGAFSVVSVARPVANGTRVS